MSNVGPLRSEYIAVAQMWNVELVMWNEGDFAAQNPNIIRACEASNSLIGVPVQSLRSISN